MKIKIQTDLFFARAERLMVRPKAIQLPAQWVLNFQVSLGGEFGEFIERSYGFPTKPTRKQIKEKREVFKGVVSWWLYYQ